jgi:hypothetical protein
MLKLTIFFVMERKSDPSLNVLEWKNSKGAKLETTACKRKEVRHRAEGTNNWLWMEK